MKKVSVRSRLRLGVLVGMVASSGLAQGQDAVRVRIETEVGNIEVEIDVERAPDSSKNFLRYVDGGFYHGGQFHRTVTMDNQPNNDVRIEVIQGGPNREKARQGFPPIPLERTNKTGLKHLDGVISMARGGPDTAISSFFFCIGDQPSLDFGGDRNPDGQGFAAFGKVLSGMDVVREIQKSPAEEQRLTPPIRIIKVVRVNS